MLRDNAVGFRLALAGWFSGNFVLQLIKSVILLSDSKPEGRG
jgi:hypothetical protein